MPKITEVEPQKKSPRRFNIFLDGQFAFGADEDLVVNYRLIPGKSIEDKDLEKLLFEAEVGKLMERMYRIFSLRQRSEKEIRDYLRTLSFKRKLKGQEEISNLAIDSLIDKLKKKEIISDEKFARAWVEARRKSKHKGERAIRQELLQKGINKEIIDLIFKDNTDYKEEELAQLTLERKIKIWKSLPSLEFKKKAYDFLFRRGFDYNIIRSVVEKILKKL